MVQNNGINAEEYIKEILPSLIQKANSGNVFAMFHLAMCCANGQGVTKDESEAFRYSKLAVEKCLAGAQLYVGNCFREGLGCTVDALKAVRYYKLAADQAHP